MPVGTRGVGPSRAGLAEQPHPRRRSTRYVCYRWGYWENRGLRDTIGGCRPLPAAQPPSTVLALVGNPWLEAPRADRSPDAP